MNWVQALLTFTVVWWLILFMALPFGAQPQAAPLVGNAPSAPANPRLVLKFAVTTVLAAIVTLAIYGVIQSGWISFRPPPAG